MLFVKILIVLVVVLIIFAAMAIACYGMMKKNLSNQAMREVGTVVGQIPSKIPFLARNHIMLTRKGRPYYAFSQPMFNRNLFKIGARVPVAMQAVKVHGEKVQIAYILQKSRHLAWR